VLVSIRNGLLASLCLAVVGALMTAGPASAITLGSVAPPNLGDCTSCDGFQLKVVAGEPKYRVPPGPTGLWTITSWSSQGGGTSAGEARLRVWRPTSTPGQFKLVRQSIYRTIPPNGHPSFSTSLNVKDGDLLGLGTVSGMVLGYSPGTTGSDMKLVFCDPTGTGQLVGAGTGCSVGDLPNNLVNVSATLKVR
jgi:hypothetical protein